MSVSFQTLAQIRFGFGLSPNIAGPANPAAMINALRRPDLIAQRLPIQPFAIRAEQTRALGDLRKARNQKKSGAEEAYKAENRAANDELVREMRVSMVRGMAAQDGFRERLVRFWADHFSVSGRGPTLRFVATAYVEDAIRPNITGKFRDLLKAASLHPVMMLYLDQNLSYGLNSKIGKKHGRGLNENLAREILELHSLGVGGAYQQIDVREFAELLTGLTYNYANGFKFRKQVAEPGAETLLGKSYGGKKPSLNDIHAAFDDIARHPDTARHIARKLAVHFVADTPDASLVDHLAAVFTDNDGDLLAVYEALLAHPAAWRDFGRKAKQPFDFMVSAMRAMAIDTDKLLALRRRKSQLYFTAPLQIMGQPYQQPSGPDGWPEPIEDWITPQGLAARVQWALMAINELGREIDPQEFARTALGEVASERLVQAAGFAESRLEGMVLVLASPEFNRR